MDTKKSLLNSSLEKMDSKKSLPKSPEELEALAAALACPIVRKKDLHKLTTESKRSRSSGDSKLGDGSTRLDGEDKKPTIRNVNMYEMVGVPETCKQIAMAQMKIESGPSSKSKSKSKRKKPRGGKRTPRLPRPPRPPRPRSPEALASNRRVKWAVFVCVLIGAYTLGLLLITAIVAATAPIDVTTK